jgi:hypothetical protein
MILAVSVSLSRLVVQARHGVPPVVRNPGIDLAFWDTKGCGHFSAGPPVDEHPLHNECAARYGDREGPGKKLYSHPAYAG